MSKVFIEEETLIGIGNAIREKNGTTDLIATTDMATAISNLTGGGGTLKMVNLSDDFTVNYLLSGKETTSLNWNGFSVDCSSVLGTEDTIPFIITITAGSSNSNQGSLTIAYDGKGVFTQLNEGPHQPSNYYVGYWMNASNFSINQGVITASYSSTNKKMMKYGNDWTLAYFS